VESECRDIELFNDTPSFPGRVNMCAVCVPQNYCLITAQGPFSGRDEQRLDGQGDGDGDKDGLGPPLGQAAATSAKAAKVAASKSFFPRPIWSQKKICRL